MLEPVRSLVASTMRVRETIEMAAIFEPHLDVVALEREGHAALARYASSVARESLLGFATTVAFDDEGGLDGLDELARLLPPDDARDVLLGDIAYWVEVVTELTAANTVGVRVARLQAPMCPAFHVDRVTLRLVCSYAGPGTQWIDATTGGLGTVPLPSQIESCSPLDVVLLKGSAWPGNARRGAVHRSPPGSAPRLLLTIDPLD